MRRDTFSSSVLLLLPRLAGAPGTAGVRCGRSIPSGLQQQWLQLKALCESVAADRQPGETDWRIRSARSPACIPRLTRAIRNLARLDLNNITDLYGMMHQLQSKLSPGRIYWLSRRSVP